MNCSICGGIVAGSQPMSTTLPLCTCQWRNLPDVKPDLELTNTMLRSRISELERADHSCEVCHGGCPDKDHHATHHYCDECHEHHVVLPMQKALARLAALEAQVALLKKVAEAANRYVLDGYSMRNQLREALDAARDGGAL